MSTAMDTDQPPSRRVVSGVSQLAATLAAALVALGLMTAGGCNKDKKAGTTPAGSSGSVTSEDTALMGDGTPVGTGAGGAGPGAGPGGDQASGAELPVGSGGDDTAAAGDPELPAEPPTIEPPDMDLEPSVQAQKVAGHLQTGRAALRGPSKDPDLAIREARSALEADGTSVDAVVMMAHAYHTKRLFDTAEVVLDQLFKSNKKATSNPGVFYVYGLVYDRTNRPEQAKLAYEKAVALAPTYRSALINLGVHYLRNKSYEQAMSLYEQLTGELEVATAATWTNLGSAYRGRSGDYPVESDGRNQLLRQAETAYKRALSTDRSYPNVYYNLGLLYLDADPFPGPDGAPLDLLKRLEFAKTYFDEYRAMPGVNLELVDSRSKEVTKLIKRETKRREREQKKQKPDSGSGDNG